MIGKARILIFALILSPAYSAQSDKDRIAELTRQNGDLIQQIKAATQNQAELVKLRAQITARSKDAAAINRDAASSRTEAQATAAGQSDAIATVQQSADAIQLQLAQLNAARPINSVQVWLAAIAVIGTLFGLIVTVILAVINHSKVNTVAEHVNGLNEKMGAAREQKGRDDARAEDRMQQR